jgi:hypothetical protein
LAATIVAYKWQKIKKLFGRLTILKKFKLINILNIICEQINNGEIIK